VNGATSRFAGRRWLMAAILGPLVLANLALAAVYVGIYADREFGEIHLFVKHRASLQVYFHSPLGEGDLPPGGLPPEAAAHEAAFVEFVEENGGWERSVVVWY
jgi:hypothetical protein